MKRSPVGNYVAAAAVVAAVVSIIGPVERLVGPGQPLIFFVPAVTIAAWIGGLGPGLLGAALSALICFYFYFPPYRSVRVDSPSDQFQLVLFCLQGVAVSLFMESLHAARRRVEEVSRRAEARRDRLRKSEEEFRTLADAVPQLVWTADPDGNTFWYNKKWYEYTGKTFEDMRGGGWRSVHDQATLPLVMERWSKSLASGEPFDMVLPLRGADGVFRPFLTRVNAVKDAEGRVVRWFGTNTDVTESRRAEELNARLAAIVESSEDAIVGKNLDGVVTSWNASAERLFGYAAGEIVGREVLLIIPPDRLDEESEILGRLRRGVAVDHFETVRRRKDGSLIEVSLTISPIRDAVGRVVGASKIARDISERRRAEKQQIEKLELQSRFAGVAACVPGVVYSFRMRPDGSSCMPFATAAVEDLYGIPASVLAEDFSPVYANVHPDDARVLREDVDESFRRSTPWYSRFRYRHPVKGERWIEGRAALQAEPDGSVLWHGFLMDVTDLVATESAKRDFERLALSVLESLPNNIAVVDEAGRILVVNRAWRRFAEENGAVGRVDEGADYFEVCNAATGEVRPSARAVAAGIRDVLAARRGAFEFEYPCHSPSRRRWFLGRVSPFVGGGPRRVVVSHEDVTAMKVAEERLRYRERMLAQSQAMAHVGSWELDLDDREDLARNALRWSDECCRIFGYEPGQVRVDNDLFLKSVHPDDRDPIAAAMRAMIATGDPYEIEHRITLPDGSERIVHEWAEILADPDGLSSRVVGTCQDVTEQRQVEATLKGWAERLETLSRQVLRAQEDERRRIARELHDEIGQALTALKINLQEAREGRADGPARLDDSIAIVGEALQQVRSMALDLRPSILDDLGLVAALEWYVERKVQRTGLKGRFVAEPEDVRADPEIETVCFRVAQEALTNVARHAHASRFSVELRGGAAGLRLVVRDDGIGFDPAAALRAASRGASLGLSGMQERVELVGGQIEFTSAASTGTEIQVDLPAAPLASHRVDRVG
ncbi:PAS domain S-box protein [Paludisphaera mucosa]|uniref:Oxygen sensor histidine kinase NreB n=1 Tax=Paludisphaera mucosa TaxID=3030827 RepID=A0ABT6FE16_9BACT|nr:PAS domain S-box protein [Paludisphaera mucosa]MDG3005719.1 PAS domain S-box protein [Paludisphaera mucosa]